MARIRAEIPNKHVQSADLSSRQASERDTHRHSHSLKRNAMVRRTSSTLMMETHNNVTLNPTRMSNNVMFFTGQARLISPGSSPALRCSACTVPRLPRRAQPPHGTERASIFHQHESVSPLPFFPPFCLSHVRKRTRGARAVHALPPPSRAHRIHHVHASNATTQQQHTTSENHIITLLK